MNATIDLDRDDHAMLNSSGDLPSSEQTPNTISSGNEADSRKRKRSTSGSGSGRDTWAHFEKYEDSKTKKWRARCKHCKIATYAIGNGSSTHGTTNLNKHIFEGGCVALQNKDAYEVIESYNNKLQKRKFSQDAFREIVAMIVIKYNYPFSFVEHVRIREVFSY